MAVIAPKQNKHIHALLTLLEIGPVEKVELVKNCTQGRTIHSSEMSYFEAQVMITELESKKAALPQPTEAELKKQSGYESCNKMRRKILSRCHTIGIYQRDKGGQLVFKNGKQVLDFAAIDAFCTTKGPYKKKLQENTYDELRVLVGVFDKLTKATISKL